MSSSPVLEAFRNTVAFNLGALDREIAEFAAIQHPNSLDELRARAMGTFYAGFYEQARPLINALVGLEPSERHVVKLAQVEQRLGNSERAASVAERALKLFPGSFSAYEVLACALMESGQHERARAAAQQALSLKPDSPRMKALAAIADLAMSGSVAVAGSLVSTGDSSVDALLSNLFVGGSSDTPDISDVLGRLSTSEFSTLMSRAEAMR